MTVINHIINLFFMTQQSGSLSTDSKKTVYMCQMRQIGKRIKREQNLSDHIIKFLVVMAYAILYAFSKAEVPSMKDLADELDVSRTTLYKYLRLSVKVLVWLYDHKKSPEVLTKNIALLKEELANCQKALLQARKKIDHLTAKLFEMEGQIGSLQAEVEGLKEQWALTIDRLIVVLKMSGRCTVRSIVEVLEYGLAVKVSVGYVQNIITQAGTNAKGRWQYSKCFLSQGQSALMKSF